MKNFLKQYFKIIFKSKSISILFKLKLYVYLIVAENITLKCTT